MSSEVRKFAVFYVRGNKICNVESVMSNEMVRCPKCSHEQHGGKECASCGVIFAKYERYLQRQQELEEKESGEKRRRSRALVWSLQALALIVVTAGATWHMMKPGPSSAPDQTGAGVAENSAVEEMDERIEPPAVTSSSALTDNQPTFRTGFIERARRATVSVETPWGTGSGFFVSENFIVTNRHVVELDQEQLDEFRRKVEALGELIDLERKKIRNMKKEYSRLPKGPGRQQLRIIIEEHQRELAKVEPKYEAANQRLQRMEQQAGPADMKVIMADGSEHSADFLLYSDNYDLALLSISVPEHPYLRRPPETYRIQQGDKVYTIGSPVGLRNTVTAGIFSGYRQREDDGNVFLQTDAPINPGNSGGPLIDEKGYVRGVNTMILSNTEGIGFAIPIETVFEDFGSSLY